MPLFSLIHSDFPRNLFHFSQHPQKHAGAPDGVSTESSGAGNGAPGGAVHDSLAAGVDAGFEERFLGVGTRRRQTS